MTILGLDTATPAVSVAVVRGEGEWEHIEPAGRLLEGPAHSRELMPALARVMEAAGVEFGDLQTIAVGIGPGGYTGLRIGIATARSIARAAGVSLRPVSSLAALAAGLTGPSRLAVIDARRGEVFCALESDSGECWPPFVATPTEVAKRLRRAGISPVTAGDGSLRFRDELAAAGARVLPADSREHVIGAVQVCRRAARVPDSEPGSVLPDYLRDPDAMPQR